MPLRWPAPGSPPVYVAVRWRQASRLTCGDVRMRMPVDGRETAWQCGGSDGRAPRSSRALVAILSPSPVRRGRAPARAPPWRRPATAGRPGRRPSCGHRSVNGHGAGGTGGARSPWSAGMNCWRATDAAGTVPPVDQRWNVQGMADKMTQTGRGDRALNAGGPGRASVWTTGRAGGEGRSPPAPITLNGIRDYSARSAVAALARAAQPAGTRAPRTASATPHRPSATSSTG